MFGHDDAHDNQGSQDEPVDDGMLTTPTQIPTEPATQGAVSPAYPQSEPSLTLPPSMPRTAPAPASAPSSVESGDLISIKQDALQQLKPLVGHLDQTPEERFRTTMMMIQAADDQSLIPEAYDAAKSITDEKLRAQALLDVVNEINYFTTQNLQA